MTRMTMNQLVIKLYNKIFEYVSSIIDPLVKESKDWIAIESSINRWFERKDVLGWCFDQVKHFANNGVVFYNEHGVLISANNVCNSLKEDKYVDKVKADVLLHYGKKVPKKVFLNKCSPNTRLFIQLYADGRYGGFGCAIPPKKNNDPF